MTRTIELICDIDIEQTFYSFHAHAIPDGAEIGPGDMVLIHDAPTGIEYGDIYTGQRRATLFRANPIIRAFTRLASIFEITELYEVGFQPIDTKG
ncbi:MAG: hypothetical protein POH28_05305 [Acidocella sp.]|nr:hypothetical protein [Acidocella sp.]